MEPTFWFSEENKRLFFSAYGQAEERMLMLDRINAPVVCLTFAMQRKVFPDWAREAVEALEELPKHIEAYF